MTPEEIANFQATMQAVQASQKQGPNLLDIVNSLSGQRPQAQPVNLPPAPNFAPQEIPLGQQMANSFAGALRGLPRGPQPIVAGAPVGVNSAQANDFQNQIATINQTMLQNRAQKLNEERAAAEQAQREQQMEMEKKKFEMDNYRTSIDVEKAKKDLSAPDPVEMELFRTNIQTAVQQGMMEAETGQRFLEMVGGKQLDEMGLSGEAARVDMEYKKALTENVGKSSGSARRMNITPIKWSDTQSELFDGMTGVTPDDEGVPAAAEQLARQASLMYQRGADDADVAYWLSGLPTWMQQEVAKIARPSDNAIASESTDSPAIHFNARVESMLKAGKSKEEAEQTANLELSKIYGQNADFVYPADKVEAEVANAPSKEISDGRPGLGEAIGMAVTSPIVAARGLTGYLADKYYGVK
jgi:hypothetical protein